MTIDQMTTGEQLYRELERLRLYRMVHGRGRTEEATQARYYSNTMIAKAKARLRALGLPVRPEGDNKVYGPGQAKWQGAR